MSGDANPSKFMMDMVLRALRQGDDRKALALYLRHLDQGHSTPRTIIYSFGDWDGALRLIKKFFIDDDLHTEPRLSSPSLRAVIFNYAGFYLKGLGDLMRSEWMFRRSIHQIERIENLVPKKANKCLAIINRNLADTYYLLSDMAQATETNDIAHAYSIAGGSLVHRMHSKVVAGMLNFNRGRTEDAMNDFSLAERLQRKAYRDMPFLQGPRGISHARCLVRANYTEYARQIMEANLSHAYSAAQPSTQIRAHCLLGHMDLKVGKYEEAERHCKIAEQYLSRVNSRVEQIEVSHLRGCLSLHKDGQPEQAISVLERTLALTTGFNFEKVDILNDLAQCHQSAGHIKAAREAACNASFIGSNVGYWWGTEQARQLCQRLGIDPPGLLVHRVHDFTTQSNPWEGMTTYRIVATEEAHPYFAVPKEPGQGTAWFVTPDTVVTAFHNVGNLDQCKWKHEVSKDGKRLDFEHDGALVARKFRYYLEMGGKEIDLTPLHFDPKSDLALLKVGSPVENACVLNLADFAIQAEDAWSAPGYPSCAEKESMLLFGEVKYIACHNSPKTRIQLKLNLKGNTSWEGSSGSPVFIRGRVAGVLLCAIDEARTTLWAASADSIRQLIIESSFLSG